MKTIVVLSAIAAVALAAPTQPEKGSEDFKKFTNIPETFKRERKSVQEFSSDPTPGQPANLPSTSLSSESGVTGRSFGFKKPIVIKKKPIGYQVYRDSDEAPAESGETCGSQVKVKFCDSKSKLKSSTIEESNTEMTKEEMKHSITLAKEAIENLQRDWNTAERIPSAQANKWNHGMSESDVELHQDIEIAREALEHVHKNFGNLESLSLHATTFKEADVIPEASFTIAKTEEQRLAQWKEAMDAIQKNAEIMKNIEDSFRTMPDGESAEMVSENLTIQNNKEDSNNKLDHEMRPPQDMVQKSENEIESENCKTGDAHEKPNGNGGTNGHSKPNGLVDNDMASSASTISDEKIKMDQTRPTSQAITGTDVDQLPKTENDIEGISNGNDAKVDTIASEDLTLKDLASKDLASKDLASKDLASKDMASEDMASKGMASEDMASKNMASEDMASKDMASKDLASKDPLSDKVRSAEINMQEEIKKTGSTESEDLEIENKEKDAVSTETLESSNISQEKPQEMKSGTHLNQQLNMNNKEDKTQTNLADLETGASIQTDTTLPIKSQEEITNTNQKMAETNMQGNLAIGESEKHLAEARMADKADLKTQQAILASVNEAEQMGLQIPHSLFHPEMRATEDLQNMHQQLLLNPQTRWAENKNMQLQRESMTSANGIHSLTEQHAGHHHHHHQLVHAVNNHHFETPSGLGFHSRFPEQMMAQEKSADTEMQAYYMGMRDGSDLTAENQRFRWKPTQDAPRSAYGAPVAPPPSVSASAVFPNANLGGCGIPLLLSCNPTVVSGNLAKPAPYAAPAYRTDDDFTFHTKRDAKKAHESLPSPLHRTKTNLQTGTVLVAKQ